MQDTFPTIIALFLAAILIFIVPLITFADRNDTIVQEDIQTIVDEFVTDVQSTGILTMEKYEKFENKIIATGNMYDIQIEIQLLDENPSKKTSQTSQTKIGENVYYSEYTTQILEQLKTVDSIELKEGDMIIVKVANVSTTLYESLKNSFLKVANDGTATIAAHSSGMIITNGQADKIYVGVTNELSKLNVLVVGFSNNDVHQTTYEAKAKGIADVLNQNERYNAEYEIFRWYNRSDDSERLAEYGESLKNRKTRYDVIILDSFVYCLLPSKAVLQDIFQTTNLITVANDATESTIPFINSGETWIADEVAYTTYATDIGNEKIGIEVDSETDGGNFISFTDDVEVLYEVNNQGTIYDAIGMYQNSSGKRWIHSQVPLRGRETTQIMEKLVYYASGYGSKIETGTTQADKIIYTITYNKNSGIADISNMPSNSGKKIRTRL